jgi:hypothetical protein
MKPGDVKFAVAFQRLRYSLGISGGCFEGLEMMLGINSDNQGIAAHADGLSGLMRILVKSASQGAQKKSFRK